MAAGGVSAYMCASAQCGRSRVQLVAAHIHLLDGSASLEQRSQMSHDVSSAGREHGRHVLLFLRVPVGEQEV